MADVRLAVAKRSELGSATSGRLRKTGAIPGVVYGTGHEPIAVSVDGRELRAALSGQAGLNALLELHMGDETHPALARELQRHPTKGTVQHVDFQIVRLDQEIMVDVPVEVIGEAHDVTVQGGVIVQDVVNLTVKATPATIPSVIEIDVSALELGGIIRLGDITLPNGVTSDLDPETVMVTGLIPRVIEEEPVEGEAVEGEEGAEGEGGDAAASAGGEAASEAPAASDSE